MVFPSGLGARPNVGTPLRETKRVAMDAENGRLAPARRGRTRGDRRVQPVLGFQSFPFSSMM
jgi:hypothetical protein